MSARSVPRHLKMQPYERSKRSQLRRELLATGRVQMNEDLLLALEASLKKSEAKLEAQKRSKATRLDTNSPFTSATSTRRNVWLNSKSGSIAIKKDLLQRKSKR